MAKANYFAPMKKAFTGKNKVAWIAGAVVLFGFFYFAFSKQSDGAETNRNSGNVLVQGPSEAEIMAQMQGQALALEANTAMQQAALAAGVQQQEFELTSALAALEFQARESQGERDLELGRLAINSDADLTRLSFERDLHSQQMVTDIAMSQIHSQENMFVSQLENNRAMFESQMSAARFNSLIQGIGTAKRKDRDTLLGALIATSGGNSFTGGSGDDRLVIGAPQNYNNRGYDVSPFRMAG